MDCVKHPGYIGPGGYPGQTQFKGIRDYGHRNAWRAANGPIPEGMQIDHVCTNTWCVNPSHLDLVTCAENMRRRSMRMTTCGRGHERNPDTVRMDAKNKKRCMACAKENYLKHRYGGGAGD